MGSPVFQYSSTPDSSTPVLQQDDSGSRVCGARQCEGGQAGPQGGQDDRQQPPAARGQDNTAGSSGDQPSHAAAASALHEGSVPGPAVDAGDSPSAAGLPGVGGGDP